MSECGMKCQISIMENSVTRNIHGLEFWAI